MHVGSPHAAAERASGTVAPLLGRPRVDAARARARIARLRRQERLPRDRRRRVRRDRLGADGGARRARRSGRSACTACRCRRAISSEGTRGDAQLLAETSAADFLELPIEPLVEAFLETLAEPFARARAGPDRGEPPGAHSRRALDGALEQVRLARRRDREQVRALGRLRHALRGHGRRIRAPEGRVQDGRLPPGAASERAGGARADPPLDHRARAERRASRRPARRGLAAALSATSTGCSRRMSSSTSRART